MARIDRRRRHDRRGPDGHVDLAQLEAELERYRDRPADRLVLGGLERDRDRHRHRRRVVAAAPVRGDRPVGLRGGCPVRRDRHGSPADGDGYLDAIFISPHKLIGGPGTPGLLVARRALFTNRVPDVPGGGTVAYVNPDEHDYLVDVEHREEGGTPDIVGSIRAGLVFQLKQAVGLDEIQRREEGFLGERSSRGRPTRT